MIACTLNEWTLGPHQTIDARRTVGEGFHTVSIIVTREATRQEYVDYVKAEGLDHFSHDHLPGMRYYEILMD